MITVALGANLPGPNGASPLATCKAAIEALRGLTGLRLERVSSWYATAPIPSSDQPDYTNGVALLAGCTDPFDLLRRLQSIEHRAGRVRGLVNAPRVLDLDIVAMDDLVRHTDDLILPHPRMHERAFVLRPMAEILPGWRHPLLGKTVAQMLAEVPPQGIRAL
jgi:2-amino-4-hydroxy-6-hydroxymethyldihydropteridine diphosphokinase